MSSPQCRVYEAKDWLLHAQNALLVMLLGEGDDLRDAGTIS